MNKKIIIIPAALLSLSLTLPYVFAEEKITEEEIATTYEEQEEMIIIDNNEINTDTITTDLTDNKIIIKLDNETLKQDIKINNSDVEIILNNNSNYEGTITKEDSTLKITLDKTSTLTLTNNLILDSLENEVVDNSNIIDNSYTLTLEENDNEEEIIEEETKINVSELKNEEEIETNINNDNQEEKTDNTKKHLKKKTTTENTTEENQTKEKTKTTEDKTKKREEK